MLRFRVNILIFLVNMLTIMSILTIWMTILTPAHPGNYSEYHGDYPDYHAFDFSDHHSEIRTISVTFLNLCDYPDHPGGFV